ncbi:hypothetical protein Q3G72_005780 [Acer saccharum]|nr:hypothetical protein Q3G72_005780 [Acer saccharum]
MYSEGSGVKESRDADTIGIITGKPKGSDKGVENSGKGGRLREEEFSRGMTKAVGSEMGDGRYTKEPKGLRMEAVEGNKIKHIEGTINEHSKSSNKNLGNTPNKGDLAVQRDGHGKVKGCDEESTEVQMEGLEGDKGCVDVVDENVEGMSLSPRKLSVRKWRRATRKKHGTKGMVGVSSPIKRILEARQIIKKKSRDGSLSPLGKASARKKRNWIEKLDDDRGRQVTEDDDITKIVCRYFDNLFTSSSPSVEELRVCTEVIDNRINTSTGLFLESSFSKEDVNEALFSIGLNKAPGLNGFHALFFQKFWEVVRNDVSRVGLFLESSFNKEDVNEALFSMGPNNAPGPDGFHALFFQKF